jgi:hypothetical protein
MNAPTATAAPSRTVAESIARVRRHFEAKPEIAKGEAIGRVSGWGWGLGYLGGLLSLGLCLVYLHWATGRGVTTDAAVPATMLITAALFALASLPTFLLLKERAKPLAGDLRRARWLEPLVRNLHLEFGEAPRPTIRRIAERMGFRHGKAPSDCLLRKAMLVVKAEQILGRHGEKPRGGRQVLAQEGDMHGFFRNRHDKINFLLSNDAP